MNEEFDLSQIKVAAKRLDNAAHRQKYERRDFFNRNRFQQALLESVAHHRFVCGQAGGQIGKSSEAMDIAAGCLTGEMKLTNRTEPRLDRPYKFVCWILSETGQTTILGPQTRLLGDVLTGQVGTGMLPLRVIKKITYAHGVPGLVSEVVCDIGNGDLSIVRFRQYQQGKSALTSEAVDLIICDELPPDHSKGGLWAELLQRTSATQGTILVVATPGRQQSDILHWFKEPSPDRAIVRGSVDDATHFTEEQKKQIAAAYLSVSEAEYRSRYFGDEFIGGGKVLSFDPSTVLTDRAIDTFSPYAKWIIGLDLGHGGLSPSAHPTAAVLCCWDKQAQVLWIMRTYRAKQVLPESVAASILSWDKGLAPVSYGAAETQGMAGTNLSHAKHMKSLGLNMLAHHAVHDGVKGGGVAIEISVTKIQGMLTRGQLRIHRDCMDLVTELSNLERDEEGQLIPIRDDLWSALRYAEMMKRFAKPVEDNAYGVFRPHLMKPRKHTSSDFDLFTGEKFAQE